MAQPPALILGALAALGAVTLRWTISGLLDKSPRTMLPLSPSRHALLRYGPTFRLVYSVGLILCLLMAIAIAFVIRPISEPDRILSLVLVMLPLTGAFFSYTAEAFRRELTITSIGIQTRSPWGSERFVRWTDIVALKYSLLSNSLAILASNGDRIRASRYLDGMGSFLGELDRNLPPEVHQRATATLELVRRLTRA